MNRDEIPFPTSQEIYEAGQGEGREDERERLRRESRPARKSRCKRRATPFQKRRTFPPNQVRADGCSYARENDRTGVAAQISRLISAPASVLAVIGIFGEIWCGVVANLTPFNQKGQRFLRGIRLIGTLEKCWQYLLQFLCTGREQWKCGRDIFS